MRFAAYQVATSGASAVRKLRIWVLYASRSMMVVSMSRSGCSAPKRAIMASIVARGAGLEVSRKILRSPVRPAEAGADRNAAAANAAAVSVERMAILLGGGTLIESHYPAFRGEPVGERRCPG